MWMITCVITSARYNNLSKLLKGFQISSGLPACNFKPEKPIIVIMGITEWWVLYNNSKLIT